MTTRHRRILNGKMTLRKCAPESFNVQESFLQQESVMGGGGEWGHGREGDSSLFKRHKRKLNGLEKWTRSGEQKTKKRASE